MKAIAIKVSPSTRRLTHTAKRAGEARAAQKAGQVAAAVATGLALGKLIAGQLGHSIAVTASAVDSLMDVFASSANALAIRLAHTAPDEGHPFGHAKIEALATAAQGVLIAGSGAYLLIKGVRRLITPEPLQLAGVTIGTMVLATVVTVALVAHLGRVATRTESIALKADATHYRTDIFSNVAVLIGVGVTYATGFERIDGALSILVAGYVIVSATGMLRLGVRGLLDERAPLERIRRLEDALASLTTLGEIKGYHGLRTRMAGKTIFVEVHVELPGEMPLKDAHAVSDLVRDALREADEDAEVLVHIDAERDEPA